MLANYLKTVLGNYPWLTKATTLDYHRKLPLTILTLPELALWELHGTLGGGVIHPPWISPFRAKILGIKYTNLYIYINRDTMYNFSPSPLKMWVLEPIWFWVSDDKNGDFENFTKEKSRFLSFRSPPKFNRRSDWPQIFFKRTTMDIC